MSVDPLVPRDFGGWFGRVFGMFRREFVRLGALAVVPAVLTAIELVALTVARPSQGEMQGRLAEVAAASPTGTVGFGAGFGIVFGWMLPIVLPYLVVMLVVSALYQGTAFFVALRRANGQPTTVAEALRFAVRRMLPFIGWSMVGGFIFGLAITLPLAPGLAAQVIGLLVVGALVSIVLGVLVGVVVFSSLYCVVFIERAGLPRCRELIRGRFWATFARVLVALLIYLGYLIAVSLLVSAVSALLGSRQVDAILRAVVTIPVLVFQTAVLLITYAELRFHENPATSTRTLAAELGR